jgi:ABC-type phosphate/phosphonate transport system substrate-binding protein
MPIYNDTISARANLPEATKEAVMNAFEKTAPRMATITTEGTGAYYLYQIYSHTGYSEAKDSDFDGERAFYQLLRRCQPSWLVLLRRFCR